MEANSSGEELVIKTRKPYTITKQRERWTEEEHNRFLEALRLYGRAWQKIEDHIGTKTAVQIRSHAQKFFSKLEKEAHVKGVPIGQAVDIDIPPPRPKRKPRNPYPRKTANGSLMLQAVSTDGKLVISVSSSYSKEAPESGNGSLSEKPNEEKQPPKPRENQGDNCSESFTHFQEAHSQSVSSVQTAALTNSFAFREFLPSREEDNGTKKDLNLEKNCNLHAKSLQRSIEDHINGKSQMYEQGTQTYPKHIPVHVLDGSSITCTLSPPPTMPSQDSLVRPMEETHVCSNSLVDPPASAVRSEHHDDAPRSTCQTFPAYHPSVAPVPQTPDDYSSFANLIMSTLLQNPAVHAAATFAASFWPHNHACSSTCTEEGLNSHPNLAAIAAATVAAATAWWATHGLLPLCSPFRSAFPCHPPPGINGPASAAKVDRKETSLRNPPMQNQELDPENSEASQARRSASRSTSSPSDSEESEDTKQKTGPKPACREKPAAGTDPNGSNEMKKRKQVDRSSSGSNTPTSSDIEVDASEKHEAKGQDEAEDVEAAANPQATESSTRRSRSSNNLNEVWKAVSEEGRLAFEALFSRDVLPQSFSPRHGTKYERNQKGDTEEEKKSTKAEHGDALAFDLNSNVQTAASDHSGEKTNTMPNGEKNQEGFLAIGLGNAKLKGGKTGFRPYKRCSMEAKENRLINPSSVAQIEQKDPKRSRLESEATST